MRTTEEPTNAYIDAAIERMEAGLTRHIRIRARHTVAISVVSATAVVALVAGGVGLASAHSSVISPPLAFGTRPLSAADVASWTSTATPTAEVTPVVSACEAILAREPQATGIPSIVNADVRGEVQSVIVALGDYSGYCIGTSPATTAFVILSLPDDQNITNYTTPPVPPDAINLGPTGSHTTANGWSFAEGAAGSRVTGITLHENGLDIVATVANGTWMAWWPTHGQPAAIGGTFTITSADGSTSTVTPAQIQLN